MNHKLSRFAACLRSSRIGALGAPAMAAPPADSPSAVAPATPPA